MNIWRDFNMRVNKVIEVDKYYYQRGRVEPIIKKEKAYDKDRSFSEILKKKICENRISKALD